MLFGTILVVDLRLLGAGVKRQAVSRLTANLWPWMMGSLALILTTGILLFLSEALKCYGNDGFRFKMIFLFFALIFHFTIFRRVTASDDDAGRSALWRKTIAVVSMTLWLGVGVGGRGIGFV